MHFLNRNALLRSDEKRAYAEALFDFIGEADLTIFAIITTMDAGRFQYERPAPSGDTADELEAVAASTAS